MALYLDQLDGIVGFRLRGTQLYGGSGYSVASAGDVNGDGFDDLIVGSRDQSYYGYSSTVGTSYVVFGTSDGFPESFDLDSLDGTNGFRINGIARDDLSGFAVTGVGDVNGDGIDDIAIGAPGVASYAGQSYVIFGSTEPFASDFDLASLDGSNGFVLNGIDPYDISGRSVSGAGDINGDGIDDLIVGAFRGDANSVEGTGESYVVFGTTAGFPPVLDLASLDGTNGFRIDGSAYSEFSGFDVAAAGDINGDGIDDLVVGAPNASANDRYNSGSSYVVFGSSAGFAASFDLSTLDGSNGFRVDGVGAFDQAGYSVAGAGDVNGDGVDDLIVGARGADGDERYNAGASYVVFGSTEEFAASLDLATLDGNNGFRLVGSGSYDQSGYSVAGAGDLNGDGFADLIVGAPSAEGSGYGAGESYVIFGSDAGFASVIDLAALNGSDGFRIVGINDGDRSGTSVNAAGDVNGDGFDDLIIGAPRADPDGRQSAGESYVVFGSAALGGANDDPIAADDVLEVRPSDRVDLAADNGAGVDRDPDFDDLVLRRIDGVAVAADDVITLASGLQVTFLGGTEVRFDLPGAPVGTRIEDSFDYTIADGRGGRDTATVTVDFAQDALDLAALDGSNGFRLYGADTYDNTGVAVAGAGDINGDGYDDVIVGAPGADGSGISDTGESYVVFGSDAGYPADLDLTALDGANGFRLDGSDQYDSSGRAVAGAGDVNGDGLADLIIGAPGGDPDRRAGAGESYVVFGSTAGFSRSFDLATLDGSDGFRLEGLDSGDLSGASVAGAGDVNGDGVGDVIVGAPGADPGREGRAGESYVIFGSRDGFAPSIDLGTLDGSNGFRLDGVAAGDESGISVAAAGDINDDGIDDLIVGARSADDYAGASYVLFGTDAGFAARVDLAALDGSDGFRLTGDDSGDASGTSVSAAGDFNGDGIDDLIVGAPGADADADGDVGETYVVFGTGDGFAATVDLAKLGGTQGFRLVGLDAADRSGSAVAAAGDVNRDGFDDLIVGAPSADPEDNESAGESYIVFGFDLGAEQDHIFGRPSSDILAGTGGDDETYHPGGGIDLVRTGAGADTILFHDRTGHRDVLRVTDFSADMDEIDFGGATVARTLERDDRTILFLDGPDDDSIVLHGLSESPFDLLL